VRVSSSAEEDGAEAMQERITRYLETVSFGDAFF
jgi:hypothetical protein